jgi:hypothetical protein
MVAPPQRSAGARGEVCRRSAWRPSRRTLFVQGCSEACQPYEHASGGSKGSQDERADGLGREAMLVARAGPPARLAGAMPLRVVGGDGVVAPPPSRPFPPDQSRGLTFDGRPRDASYPT